MFLFYAILSYPKLMYRFTASTLECEELKDAIKDIESELASVKNRLVHTNAFCVYFLYMLSPPVGPNLKYAQGKSHFYRSHLSFNP